MTTVYLMSKMEWNGLYIIKHTCFSITWNHEPFFCDDGRLGGRAVAGPSGRAAAPRRVSAPAWDRVPGLSTGRRPECLSGSVLGRISQSSFGPSPNQRQTFGLCSGSSTAKARSNMLGHFESLPFEDTSNLSFDIKFA